MGWGIDEFSRKNVTNYEILPDPRLHQISSRGVSKGTGDLILLDILTRLWLIRGFFAAVLYNHSGPWALPPARADEDPAEVCVRVS